MDDNLCTSYILGFCPYDEFRIDNVTKECSKIHDKQLREEYKKVGVVNVSVECGKQELKSMVHDLDKKIAYNRMCLEEMKNETDACKALDKLEAAIEDKDLEDTEKIYALLKIHGHMVLYAENNTNVKYDVCSTCGSLKDKGAFCKHKFCQSYKRLREMVASFNS